MAVCRKCHFELPEMAKFCPYCGVKQNLKHNPKRRGNGQGSVFQLKNKTWIAVKTVSWSASNGHLHRKTISKSGFRTKREALDYLPLLAPRPKRKVTTFGQLYDAWYPTHRAGESTMGCYRAAYKYFAPVADMDLAEITIDDLQDCLDECPRGKRTRENMKALCGLLYKYAIPRRLTDLDFGPYLIVGGGSDGEKEGLPLDALDKIGEAAGHVPVAEYVLCQCYLGFRPSELLALQVSDYDPEKQAFCGGAKTDAGRDRIVTISPKIQPIIDRLCAKPNGPVFSSLDAPDKPMALPVYRNLFYALLEQCGIPNPIVTRDGIEYHTYTPHSCRHTFATLMKRVPGADKDKLELIGHTSTEMLRHYQDVDLDDLRRITDAL